MQQLSKVIWHDYNNLSNGQPTETVSFGIVCHDTPVRLTLCYEYEKDTEECTKYFHIQQPWIKTQVDYQTIKGE